MAHLNVEIKARCEDQEAIKRYLRKNGADFKGIDHQVDTYFVVPNGRLKLREGNIENALIYYERDNQAGPKEAKVEKSVIEPDPNMKKVLANVFKILVIVDKQREIAFIDNVKFHIDRVKGLGKFIEIEAIDETGRIGKEKLLQQCQRYLKDFGVKDQDLVPVSYSDLLMNR